MLNLSALNLFSKKSPSPHFLALDVGSDFCKVLVLKRPEVEGDPLRVVGVGRVPQGLTDMRSGVPADIMAVTKNIEAALGEATLSCDFQPQEVVLGVAGAMVAGLTTRIRLTREKGEKPLDAKEMGRIEKKLRDAAFIEASAEMARHKGQEHVEIEIINSEITQVEIDGFPAANPLGFKGEKMELSYFTAFSPRNQLDVLSSMVRSLGLKPLAVTSEMFALVKLLLRSQEAAEFDAILLDIGGETTDIAAIFGGNIVASRTLPLGGRDFTRAIMYDRNLTFAEAEDLKLRLAAGSLDSEEQSRVEAVLTEVKEVWGSGVKEALLEMAEVEIFAPRLLLTGGGAELPGISELLASPAWSREITFSQPPKVSLVNPKDLVGVIDETGKIGTTNQVGATDWVMPLAVGNFGLTL